MVELTNILIAFGSGTIVSTAVQYFLNERSKRKTLVFKEKKEAFVGLLQAYHLCAVEPSDRHAKDFAYWQIRCELICNDDTKSAIQNVIDTNSSIGRNDALEKMKRMFALELSATI